MQVIVIPCHPGGVCNPFGYPDSTFRKERVRNTVSEEGKQMFVSSHFFSIRFVSPIFSERIPKFSEMAAVTKSVVISPDIMRVLNTTTSVCHVCGDGKEMRTRCPNCGYVFCDACFDLPPEMRHYANAANPVDQNEFVESLCCYCKDDLMYPIRAWKTTAAATKE